MQRRISKSKEKMCYCNQTMKKQLVAVAGCSDDFAAVSALPDNWKPRHCGATLINFLKKQEKNHEDILKDIVIEAQCVNKDIDGKVGNIAEILLCDIRQNNVDIDCIIQKFHTNNNRLSIEDRDNVLNQITKLSIQRTEDLMKFKQEALGLERQRADGLRKILNSQFQCLLVVGHKPPKILLHEFDEQIYEINQQLLSNSRAYIELEAQLRLQLDECIIRARSILNQFCISDVKTIRNKSSLPSVKHLSFVQITPNSAQYKKSQVSKDISNSFTIDLEEAKKNISQMVELYSSAYLKVLKEFIDKLDNLNDNINVNRFSIDKSSNGDFNLDKIINDVLDLISKCNDYYKSFKYKNIDEIIHTDALNFQKSLCSFIKRLDSIYSILSDLCHIWNDHINRSFLVQKIMMLGLADLQTTQDALELSNEITFNIALEQMRCASDCDKLQQQFDVVTNYLSKTTETYYIHKEAEIAKLEDFTKYASMLSQILLSEYYWYLEKHPKVLTQLTEKTNIPAESASSLQDFLSCRIPLLQLVLQIQLQEQEINDCTNSCVESIENNYLTISEYSNHESRKWIDKNYSLVRIRYFLKLMSHSVRAERVKAARETRLSELRFHDLRLSSHLDSIYNLIDVLPLEASEFVEINSPNLYPFCKWISDIKSNIDILLSKEPIDLELKRLKMNSYAQRLVKHRQLFEESLDSVVDDYKKDVENKIQKARISNVKYMTRLKLFSEGGRYAATEAIRSCTALVKAGDALESCIHRTMEALHQRRIQLLVLADHLIIPLQRIVEDVTKYSAKSTFDRKKLEHNKKK